MTALPTTDVLGQHARPAPRCERYAMLDAARKLGTSHFKLFALAREHKLLDEHNRPTQRAIDRGLFLPRTIRKYRGDQEIIRASAAITPAGIQWANETLYGADRDAYLAGISLRTLGHLMVATEAVLREGAEGDGNVSDEALADLADALDAARNELEADQ